MSTSHNSNQPIKHGLYARHFTRLEQAELRKMPFDDLRPEIALLRVLIDHLTELASKETNLEKSIWALNAISLAATRLNSLVRTQAALNGTTDPLDEALQLALAAEPFYLDTEPGTGSPYSGSVTNYADNVSSTGCNSSFSPHDNPNPEQVLSGHIHPASTSSIPKLKFGMSHPRQCSQSGIRNGIKRKLPIHFDFLYSLIPRMPHPLSGHALFKSFFGTHPFHNDNNIPLQTPSNLGCFPPVPNQTHMFQCNTPRPTPPRLLTAKHIRYCYTVHHGRIRDPVGKF